MFGLNKILIFWTFQLVGSWCLCSLLYFLWITPFIVFVHEIIIVVVYHRSIWPGHHLIVVSISWIFIPAPTHQAMWISSKDLI